MAESASFALRDLGHREADAEHLLLDATHLIEADEEVALV